MATTDNNALKIYRNFCAAFGDAESVDREVRQYWASDGTPPPSPFPDKVYEHLINKRKAEGRISPERAEFLISYFNNSFEPEPTTGYLYKHREPLVKSFARAYALATKSQRMFRIEGDVMNLSGLNAAVENTFKVHEKGIDKNEKTKRKRQARDAANRIIRVMTRIVEEYLKECGDIRAVRSGGDEIAIYVRSTENLVRKVDEKEVALGKIDVKEDIFGEIKLSRAVANAQMEIADFVFNTGLRNIVHPKQEGLPGTGIGFGISPLLDSKGKLLTDIGMRADLEEQITDLKRIAQTHLGKSLQSIREQYSADAELPDRAAPTAPPDHVDLAQIQNAINLPGFFEASARKKAQSPIPLGDDYTGETPEAARLNRTSTKFQTMPPGSDIKLEERLLKATVKLTRRIDAVTGLPQFSSIEKVIVPNFKAKYGYKTRVVHVDFNNLGGANKLGSWVGDAMSRVFATCVKEAMKANGLDKFIPYLTSQGGGKFTLLLPPQLVDTKAVEALTMQMEKEFVKRGDVPLDLTDEEVKATTPLLHEQSKSEVKKRRDGWKAGDRERSSIPFNAKILTPNMIKNTKGRRDGSHVISLAYEIDISKPHAVIKLINQLEPIASRGQTQAIENFDHRHVEIVRHGNYKRLKEQTAKPDTADNPAEQHTNKGLFTQLVGRKAKVEATFYDGKKELIINKIKLRDEGSPPTR